MAGARDRLYLIHAHHRSTWGFGSVSEPSRFLTELPDELLAAEREDVPFRRGWGGGERRGVDDGGGDWLPGGYRAPRRDPRNEPLRPVNLPDLSAPSGTGRALDAARERAAATRYEEADVDLGSGAIRALDGGLAAPSASEEGELAWRAGDRVRHRRFGDGIVVSSQMVK